MIKKWALGTLTVVGLLLFQHSILFADEEKKSLEELLIEKGVITKDDLTKVRQVKWASWIDQINFSGDLRLRYEYFNNESPTPDRQRERFRLRFGTEITIRRFLVGIRLASGGGEHVSTNQSFDSLFNQKQLWIDRAYLRWKAADWITLTGGRMPNPFFTVYSTDIVWDDDINPEGIAQNLRFKPADQAILFINAGQFVLDEDAADSNDQWLFGEQLGVELALNPATKLTLAVADYYATNIKKSNLGQTTTQDGNSRVACPPPSTDTNCLSSQYNVVDITLQLATEVGSLPIALMGDYIRNINKTTSGKNFGLQAGVVLGKASAPHTWEVAYLYKYSETDATLADLADSDFGNGGTNRKGHITWVAYNFTKYLQFKTKFFSTKVVNENLAPFRNNIDRLQVDLMVKF